MCFFMCLFHKLSEALSFLKGSIQISNSAEDFIGVFHQLLLNGKGQAKESFAALLSIVLRNIMKANLFFIQQEAYNA